jgi:folate-binding protein YgfZ
MEPSILYADRSERAKVRVVGPQDAWFLDQILTQSFQDMEPGDGREAALITVHGRMVAYMEALRTPDAFLLHLEPELREPVTSTLQRYVLSTQVEVQDVTEELGLVLVVGPGWQHRVAEIEPVAIQPTSSVGTEAGYLWLPRAAVPAALESIARMGARYAPEDELEAIRIAHGVPRWGHEMDEKTFPQEAGVDGRAVHYEKGCYLGQEAMAKIHFRGKVNRRLVRLRSSTHLDKDHVVSLDGERVGTITSAADGTALAMVRHTVEPGITVMVGDSTADVIG